MIQMRTIVMKRRAVALLGVGVLALSACGGPAGGGSDGSDGASDGGTAGDAAAPETDRTEVAALSPRIVLAHEGGVTTLDSAIRFFGSVGLAGQDPGSLREYALLETSTFFVPRRRIESMDQCGGNM